MGIRSFSPLPSNSNKRSHIFNPAAMQSPRMADQHVSGLKGHGLKFDFLLLDRAERLA
jgi:hypothetical protein